MTYRNGCAADVAKVQKIYAILQRAVASGPPKLLARVKYPALDPGEQGPPVVLHEWKDCLIVLAVPARREGCWLWLQREYKVCFQLVNEPVLLPVRRREGVRVNRWRPSDYLGPIEPSHVDLYGWELENG